MPKGVEIAHDEFKLNFRKGSNGEIEFRMDNTLLSPFGDGYLSTELFHKLRGIVNHGFNHLNKHYKTPSSQGKAWTDSIIRAGSIVRCKSVGANSHILTVGRLYIVTEVFENGSFKCKDDDGGTNYGLSNVGSHAWGVVQY